MKEDLILKLLNRNKTFIDKDYKDKLDIISKKVNQSKILVLGGAGSIGSAVVKLLCQLNPKLIHVVDINENALVELVRNIRSTIGYIDGEFKTFSIDIGSEVFKALLNEKKQYDVWLNFSALKHVRSEKDPFTLMRLVEVNIINTFKTIQYAKETGAKKYFAVSTDKASSPINMMGASKRAMELLLGGDYKNLETSSTRFGNVAFSNGSLLESTLNRYANVQPLVAPKDIKRYFLTPFEAAKLSVLSTFIARDGEVYIPILNKNDAEKDFPSIIKNFLSYKNKELYECISEQEARDKITDLVQENKWPCYFSNSDTTGEKLEEIFITTDEKIVSSDYKDIQIVDIKNIKDNEKIEIFVKKFINLKSKNSWTIDEIKFLLEDFIENFQHKSTGKYLDSKM